MDNNYKSSLGVNPSSYRLNKFKSSFRMNPSTYGLNKFKSSLGMNSSTYGLHKFKSSLGMNPSTYGLNNYRRNFVDIHMTYLNNSSYCDKYACRNLFLKNEKLPFGVKKYCR